jgi:hypothetical protein
VKFRIVELEGLRCPFVVCEGCDEVLQPNEGIVMTMGEGENKGFPAFHRGRCDPGWMGWRPLSDWLRQAGLNSGAG